MASTSSIANSVVFLEVLFLDAIKRMGLTLHPRLQLPNTLCGVYSRFRGFKRPLHLCCGRLDALVVHRLETFVYLGDDKGLTLPSSQV